MTLQNADHALKARAAAAIDAAAQDLFRVSESLHAEVEPSFQEFKAQGWLCDLLEQNGLATERGLGSLPTAFRASMAGNSPGPRVAFACEYDGLSPYGHSCGHNVSALASVAAGLGMAAVQAELPGETVILGTPGEEGGGGKFIMLDEGVFDGLDAMMLIYPGMENVAHSRALAVTRVTVEYFGRPAHASARPELGVNALDALIAGLSGIALLRQQLPSDVRVHSIIIKGGTLPQVIPDHTSAIITIRANTPAGIEAVLPKIEACLQGAAMMSGARIALQRGPRILPELRSDEDIARVFSRNLAQTGRTVRWRDELSGAWSGDTNAVSWHIPVIQPQIAMTGPDVPPHSHAFHDASVGSEARRCIIDAGKAMAWTAIDLMEMQRA